MYRYALDKHGIDYRLTDATGSSVSGKVTIFGVEAGKATSASGTASLNGVTGKHVEVR